MRPAPRCGALTLGACAILLLAPVAEAQEVPQGYGQVISANPFGLLLEFFNAEYERVVSASSTAGVGGSYWESEGDDYINADVFWRFYPGGNPLRGWSFGTKVGVTNVPDQGTYFGFGFDTNWSWLLGSNDNFYVGIGLGLKRLLGVGDDADFDLRFIPTLRFVNVGFAF